MGQRIPSYWVTNWFNHQNRKHFRSVLCDLQNKTIHQFKLWQARSAIFRHLLWDQVKGRWMLSPVPHVLHSGSTVVAGAERCSQASGFQPRLQSRPGVLNWSESVAQKCLCLSTAEELSPVTVLTVPQNPFSIDKVLVGGGRILKKTNFFLVMPVIT